MPYELKTGENLIIRKAEIEDIASVFALVEELAEYENYLARVKVDVRYYETEFEKGTFYSIVAEVDTNIVGMCIYYMTFSTWKGRCVYLEDFVVKKHYRQFGIGQLLYERLLEDSKKMGATMVRWQVLDWNDPAIRFYEKNNAVFAKDWLNCMVYF